MKLLTIPKSGERRLVRRFAWRPRLAGTPDGRKAVVLFQPVWVLQRFGPDTLLGDWDWLPVWVKKEAFDYKPEYKIEYYRLVEKKPGKWVQDEP